MRTGTVALAFALSAGMFAQDTTRQGTVQRIQVHGKGLEGNLEGDSPTRDVAVYLPPSYETNGSRRYPVVYLLHGFTDNIDKWWGVQKHFVNVPEVVNRAVAGGVREMIVVMPNALTRYGGSMYSNSVTIGNWEDYIASELVAQIDSNYRTVPNASSRGLAGHSMGGYGALRIAMKNPDVFSSVYALNPCCMSANLRPNPKVDSIKDPAEAATADFSTKVVFASAAAWSPNPKNPPFYLDLPHKRGELRPEVAAKWQANAPLANIDQYVFNLRKLQAIGIDAGTKEASIAPTVQTMHGVLNKYGIQHVFEIYEGDHVNHVAERLEKVVLPFFAAHLK